MSSKEREILKETIKRAIKISSQKLIEKKNQEHINNLLYEYEKSLYLQALKNISSEKLIQLKDEFLLSNEGKNISQSDFDFEKGKFINKVTQLTFLPWLKKMITPQINNDDFEIWKNKRM